VLNLIFIICLTVLLCNCGKGKSPLPPPSEITLPIAKIIILTQGGQVEIPSLHVLAGTSIDIPANALTTDRVLPVPHCFCINVSISNPKRRYRKVCLPEYLCTDRAIWMWSGWVKCSVRSCSLAG